jgi:hypothetical protein
MFTRIFSRTVEGFYRRQAEPQAGLAQLDELGRRRP